MTIPSFRDHAGIVLAAAVARRAAGADAQVRQRMKQPMTHPMACSDSAHKMGDCPMMKGDGR